MNSIERFSNSEFEERLNEALSVLLCDKRITPVENQSAVLLGGQSGAGKSTLHVIYKKKYEHNIVVINGDEYRKLHPRFARIQEQYGIDAPAHTAAWAGAMVEALVDALSSERYNLIIEGTLRTSSVPLKTAALLQERGYRVSLALMAVKPEISLISCQIRYELMRIAGTTPRAVDPAHHGKIVEDIVENLAELETSELIEDVSLYNRAGTCLVAAKCPAPDAPASLVLKDVLFGAWTEEERSHYEDLKKQLEDARSNSGAGERPAR
ncbi:MAG: zeta toxin family protein [Eggerthellaceae bacterium]|nr:zeta toxin family protein [Eggerthellaceae bacterium]